MPACWPRGELMPTHRYHDPPESSFRTVPQLIKDALYHAKLAKSQDSRDARHALDKIDKAVKFSTQAGIRADTIVSALKVQASIHQAIARFPATASSISRYVESQLPRAHRPVPEASMTPGAVKRWTRAGWLDSNTPLPAARWSDAPISSIGSKFVPAGVASSGSGNANFGRTCAVCGDPSDHDGDGHPLAGDDVEEMTERRKMALSRRHVKGLL